MSTPSDDDSSLREGLSSRTRQPPRSWVLRFGTVRVSAESPASTSEGPTRSQNMRHSEENRHKPTAQAP